MIHPLYISLGGFHKIKLSHEDLQSRLEESICDVQTALNRNIAYRECLNINIKKQTIIKGGLTSSLLTILIFLRSLPMDYMATSNIMFEVVNGKNENIFFQRDDPNPFNHIRQAHKSHIFFELERFALRLQVK